MFGLAKVGGPANRLIQYREDSNRYARHRSRLANIRPTMRLSEPMAAPHVILNLRRLRSEERRLGALEAENERLMRRLQQLSLRGRTHQLPPLLAAVTANERTADAILARQHADLGRRSWSLAFQQHSDRVHAISRFQHPWKGGPTPAQPPPPSPPPLPRRPRILQKHYTSHLSRSRSNPL